MNRCVLGTVVAMLGAVAIVASPVLAAVDRSGPPPLAAVSPFVLPAPQTFTLKNGLKVHVVERRRAALVDVVVSVGGGALGEPTGREGLATALADLLTQGAGDRDAFAFDDAVMAIGGRMEANASWQSTTISAQALSTRADELLALLADAVLRPRLHPEDWARKQKERLGELAYLQSEPRTLSSLAAARALFPAGRQGTGIIGTPQSVSSIDVDAIRAQHAATFRPDNAFVVVVGDIDVRAAVAGLERALGSWTAPTTPLPTVTAQEPAPLSGVSVVLLDKPGAPQSVLQVVAPIPPDVGPFDAAAGVMQTLLGGSFTSRLNGNLREKNQYAYGAGYSYDTAPAHRSRVSTSVKSSVTIPAIHEILAELERIRIPATVEELDRARAYEALTFPAVADSGAGLARAWASWLELGVTPTVVNGYMKAVLAVDAPALQVAGARLVDPLHVTIVVVGDRHSLESELKRFGPIKVMSAAELLPSGQPPQTSGASSAPSGPKT